MSQNLIFAFKILGMAGSGQQIDGPFSLGAKSSTKGRKMDLASLEEMIVEEDEHGQASA